MFHCVNCSISLFVDIPYQPKSRACPIAAIGKPPLIATMLRTMTARPMVLLKPGLKPSGQRLRSFKAIQIAPNRHMQPMATNACADVTPSPAQRLAIRQMFDCPPQPCNRYGRKQIRRASPARLPLTGRHLAFRHGQSAKKFSSSSTLLGSGVKICRRLIALTSVLLILGAHCVSRPFHLLVPDALQRDVMQRKPVSEPGCTSRSCAVAVERRA